MKRLQAGVYDDGEGGLHIDIGEMLVAHNVDDTPENRDTLTRAAVELFSGRGLPIEIRP